MKFDECTDFTMMYLCLFCSISQFETAKMLQFSTLGVVYDNKLDLVGIFLGGQK